MLLEGLSQLIFFLFQHRHLTNFLGRYSRTWFIRIKSSRTQIRLKRNSMRVHSIIECRRNLGIFIHRIFDLWQRLFKSRISGLLGIQILLILRTFYPQVLIFMIAFKQLTLFYHQSALNSLQSRVILNELNSKWLNDFLLLNDFFSILVCKFY